MLPPPPRELDDERWRPLLTSLRRTRLYTFIAMTCLLTLCLGISALGRYGPHPFLAGVGMGAVIVVLSLTFLQHRRWVLLFREGEERSAKVIKDTATLFWRELKVAVPDGEKAVVLTLTLPRSVARFEEVEEAGRRQILVIVDPRNLRRWHPVPVFNSGNSRS